MKLFSRGWEAADKWHEAWVAERGSHEITRRQLNDLTEKITAMQRAGFTVTPPEPPAPIIQRMNPVISVALDGRFPGNSPYRAQMLKWIEEQQDAGREPEWIARRIWDGEENVDG